MDFNENIELLFRLCLQNSARCLKTSQLTIISVLFELKHGFSRRYRGGSRKRPSFLLSKSCIHLFMKKKVVKEFSGFNFLLGSQDLTNKYKYLKDNFSTSDLTHIAN